MESVNWSDYNWGKFEPDTSAFKNIKEKAKANGKTIAKTYKEELEQAVNDIQKQLYDLKPTPKNEEKKLKLQADLQTAQKQLEDFQIWTGEKTIPLKFSDDWFDEQMSMAKKLQSAVEYGSDEWKQLNNKITELNNIHIQITAEINKEEIQKSINEIVQNGIKPIEIKIKNDDNFSLLKDTDKKEVDKIIQKINQLQSAYNELEKIKKESKDTITTDAAVEGLKTLQKEIDNTTESLKTYQEKQKEAEKNELTKQKISDRADAWGSYGDMLSGASQALGALKDSEANQIAQFTLNTSAMLADLVSRIMALQAETMAEGAASVFHLPFPANIAAWATVAATIGSIFASLPKFAEGGIVPGGSYSGDKVLSLVNSGEGLLTRQGVANLNKLYNNINSPTIISGTQKVEFVIKGKNLEGVLGNYDKQKNKII
jgi:predicted dinucleotide-utilizing enzyme